MSQLVRLEGKHTTQNAHCAMYSVHFAYCSLMLPPGAGCPFPGAGDTGTGGAAAESCFLVIVIIVVVVIVVFLLCCFSLSLSFR